MSTILLSIKPEYSSKIITGEKKYEYRKKIAKDTVDTILIYSTAPEMKIIGQVGVLEIISGSPTYIWNTTKINSGITRKKFREYFRGVKIAYAYRLGQVERFIPPRSLSDYHITKPPQSFVYIN